MKVIEPGHVYEVQNTDGKGTQRINFVLRRDGAAELLPENQRRQGIQSQELLRVLIDRTIYLHNEQPWPENIVVINCLRKALKMYESRAARRSIEKLAMPERHEGCKDCGHLLCFCD